MKIVRRERRNMVNTKGDNERYFLNQLPALMKRFKPVARIDKTVQTSCSLWFCISPKTAKFLNNECIISNLSQSGPTEALQHAAQRTTARYGIWFSGDSCSLCHTVQASARREGKRAGKCKRRSHLTINQMSYMNARVREGERFGGVTAKSGDLNTVKTH